MLLCLVVCLKQARSHVQLLLNHNMYIHIHVHVHVHCIYKYIVPVNEQHHVHVNER